MMSTRKLALCGKVWRYRVGKQFVVAKREDTRKGVRIPLNELVRMDWDTIEEMQRNKTFSVKPGDVARWLSRVEENK